MKNIHRQFLLYLLTGGTAAAVNYSSRMLYQLFMDFSSAVIVSYITGMVVSFFLAKKFVFQKGTLTPKKSFMYFTLINVLSGLQIWGVSIWMAYHVLPYFNVVALQYEIAHAIGLIIPVFTSFIGHKYLSFR